MLLQQYKILNSLLMEKEEIANIAEMMYNRMLDKEEEAIVKLRQVINFATNNKCMAQCLASYFGDEVAIPTGLCRSCSFCQTGEGITFEPGITTLPDPNKIKAILNACPERDDPRLLTAHGIWYYVSQVDSGKVVH
ncbi:uncharacterized protein F5891DRAFT_975517 [Suillus fuscotomentosus]|uniref:ATP-dependent DNA helicase RecQ zinc-binding domain-containing protein n=1 Tax=Suillus fuscotomentosus TaxID=1912939 RepID=A0AAD4EIL3_9AGAM|nr:uncharacterized protein F5891DRAFT_975517 [Suillus fuscotomentosus]KAG1906800.1 hypothetical protein F5891DRAFT_975517 [Suillus fuscotomentosus]